MAKGCSESKDDEILITFYVKNVKDFIVPSERTTLHLSFSTIYREKKLLEAFQTGKKWKKIFRFSFVHSTES